MKIKHILSVVNCADCPLAQCTPSKYSTFYGCNVSDEGLTVFHDSDLDDSELPLPIDCPLRTEPITISLT